MPDMHEGPSGYTGVSPAHGTYSEASLTRGPVSCDTRHSD